MSIRKTGLGLAFAWLCGALAGGAQADVLVWNGFADETAVNMGSGLDLLVGTGDDDFVADFNSNGEFAHNFFFDPVTFAVAGSAFSFLQTANDAPPLGTNGTSTDFSQFGQSVDTITGAGVLPFFYEDLPSAPHEGVSTANGRVFSFDYLSRACLETDQACGAPLSEIRYVGDGLVMLPGDVPATIVAGAPNVAAFFQTWAVGADLPAYLTQLSMMAPVGWQAIALNTYAIPIQNGVNCSGSFCPTFDGDILVGVTPSYTLPEPTGALTTLAAIGALGGLARRRRNTA